jgi:carbamoyl-phosphate synthase large subunit
MNILITSAGRRVSFITYCKEELTKRFGANSKVFTTDLDPATSPACVLSDKGFKVGRFTDPDYMAVLLQLCKDNKVKLVIPTIDTELKLMAAHREQFKREGIDLIVSDLDVVNTCRDKRLTNSFFTANGFEVPPLVNIDAPTFPVFIKPYDGSSSQNIFLVKDASMLAPYMRDKSRFMHLEYLSPTEHTEYTVDMYYDQNGTLQCLVPRIRIATRSGEVSKGITRKDAVLDFLKKQLPVIPGARGCLTLQLFFKKNQNKFYGIEINPRFGGGYPLSYQAGANYIGFLMDEYMLGKTISYTESWENNLLLLRYDQELVIHDFDYS